MSDERAETAATGGQGRGAWSYVGKHPGFVFSFVYVFVSAIGMYYEWKTFLQFDINVLDYSDAGDFFLAGVKHPLLTGGCLVLMLLFWGLWCLNGRSGNRWLIEKILVVPVILSITAAVMGSFATYDSFRKVNELLCSSHEVALVTERYGAEGTSMVIVGTTSKYVLAFRASDRADRCYEDGTAGNRPPIVAIPHSQIQERGPSRPNKVEPEAADPGTGLPKVC